MGALQQGLQLVASAEVLLGRTFCLAGDSLQCDVTAGHRLLNSFPWAHVWSQAAAAAVIAPVEGGVETWLV